MNFPDLAKSIRCTYGFKGESRWHATFDGGSGVKGLKRKVLKPRALRVEVVLDWKACTRSQSRIRATGERLRFIRLGVVRAWNLDNNNNNNNNNTNNKAVGNNIISVACWIA